MGEKGACTMCGGTGRCDLCRGTGRADNLNPSCALNLSSMKTVLDSCSQSLIASIRRHDPTRAFLGLVEAVEFKDAWRR